MVLQGTLLLRNIFFAEHLIRRRSNWTAKDITGGSSLFALRALSEPPHNCAAVAKRLAAMAGRGPQSFKKRQKEQQRKEKQQEKAAKRLQRKIDKENGLLSLPTTMIPRRSRSGSRLCGRRRRREGRGSGRTGRRTSLIKEAAPGPASTSKWQKAAVIAPFCFRPNEQPFSRVLDREGPSTAEPVAVRRPPWEPLFCLRVPVPGLPCEPVLH